MAEKKERRISLIVKPSTYENVCTMAAIDKKSVNDFIIGLIDETAEKNSAVIAEYKDLMTKAEKFKIKSD